MKINAYELLENLKLDNTCGVTILAYNSLICLSQFIVKDLSNPKKTSLVNHLKEWCVVNFYYDANYLTVSVKASVTSVDF